MILYVPIHVVGASQYFFTIYTFLGVSGTADHLTLATILFRYISAIISESDCSSLGSNILVRKKIRLKLKNISRGIEHKNLR